MMVLGTVTSMAGLALLLGFLSWLSARKGGQNIETQIASTEKIHGEQIKMAGTMGKRQTAAARELRLRAERSAAENKIKQEEGAALQGIQQAFAQMIMGSLAQVAANRQPGLGAATQMPPDVAAMMPQQPQPADSRFAAAMPQMPPMAPATTSLEVLARQGRVNLDDLEATA